MLERYKQFWESYSDYWKLYGGWKELFLSPYFHLAILVTAISSPVWVTDNGAKIWPDAAINILPNLMGFSIAGMTVFLAFSHPKTMEMITEGEEKQSYFVTVVASFFHFILIQTLALIVGFIGKHYSNHVLSGLGVLLLSYAIFVGLAMAMQLLHTSQIINSVISLLRKKEDEDSE